MCEIALKEWFIFSVIFRDKLLQHELRPDGVSLLMQQAVWMAGLNCCAAVVILNSIPIPAALNVACETREECLTRKAYNLTAYDKDTGKQVFYWFKLPRITSS